MLVHLWPKLRLFKIDVASRCDVSIEGSQPGLLSSLWRSKKSRKHDELHGTLQRGDKVLDTIHGRYRSETFMLSTCTPGSVQHSVGPS